MKPETLQVPSLARKRVFLGGPIQFAFEDGQFSQSIEAGIRGLHTHLSQEGITVLSAHYAEKFGDVDVTGQDCAVTQRDFAWMKECDVYACMFPPASEVSSCRSDGTCIELGWATALKKPVVIIREPKIEHSFLISGLHAIGRVEYVDFDVAIENPSTVYAAIEQALGHTHHLIGSVSLCESTV